MKKREYPKTVLKKKVIKGAFWTGFALVLFMSVVAIVRVGNVGAGAAVQDHPKDAEREKVNLAAGEGAQSFAENFAAHYFSWQNTDEGMKKRVERLQPYLATGLDEQAGLSFDGMVWDSDLTKSQVWNVEETGEDTALITLRVVHQLKKITQPDPKAVEKAKKNKKEPPKAKVENAGPYEKYFVVPVKTDGQSFVVHEIPYFIATPQKPDIVASRTIDEVDKVNDSVLHHEITSFLQTFFKVYTTGTQDELSYYTKGDPTPSMSGIITFQEVKNIVIKKDKNDIDYQVNTTVVFQENQSKAKVIYPYIINLTKKEDRWFVKQIKHR